jgi:hypothetical protein
MSKNAKESIFKRQLARIRTLMNQPFPEESDIRKRFFQAVRIGLFIFFFLFLFKPFGLHNSYDPLMDAIYFGLATTVVMMVYDLIVDYILGIDRQSENWTFLKWIINVLILIVFIAMANYGIMAIINTSMEISIAMFLEVALFTFLVGLFPMVFIGGIYLTGLKRKNEALAKSYLNKSDNVEDGLVDIRASDNTIKLSAKDFIYAEAIQNYVAVYVQAGDQA